PQGLVARRGPGGGRRGWSPAMSAATGAAPPWGWRGAVVGDRALPLLSLGSIVASSRWQLMVVAVQTVSVPGAGTSVVGLSRMFAAEALSARTTRTSASLRLRTGRDADRSAAPQDRVHQGYPAGCGTSVAAPTLGWSSVITHAGV